MNKLFKSVLCVLLFIASLAAKDNSKKAFAASGLPPILDRELIFGNPEIAAPELSPDGKYLAFLKPWKDTRNVYVKGVDEPFGAARLLTTEAKRPIAGFFWTRDSKYILFVKDNDGDENYNVYAVDPAAKSAAGADAPVSRDMTGLKGVTGTTGGITQARSGHHLHQSERSRQSLARSLQAENLHRRKDAGAQEHRADCRLGFRSSG
jgi:hypothetical protein